MSTTYVVTADFLFVDGKPRPLLRGDTISSLSADDVARHKAAGNIAASSSEDAKEARATPNTGPEPETVPVSHDPEGGSASALVAAANSPAPADEDDDIEGGPDTHHGDGDPTSAIVAATNSSPSVSGQRPAKAASKAAWVDYAITRGADPDEAAAMSRDDLRDKFGGE